MDVGSWYPQPEGGGQFREETPQQAHACAAFQVIGFDMNGLLGVTCLFMTNAISNIHSVVRTPCWEVRCLLHVCALWCGHGILGAYRIAQPLCLFRLLVRGVCPTTRFASSAHVVCFPHQFEAVSVRRHFRRVCKLSLEFWTKYRRKRKLRTV